MAATIETFKCTKIADNTTILPGSGKTFKTFYSPCIRDNTVAFYGNNDTYEGIYCTNINKLEIKKISDNHTNLPALNNNPPTTIQHPYIEAYVASTDSNGDISSSKTVFPCPVIDQGHVLFNASDWSNAICGIFSYDIKNDSLINLATSFDGPMKSYNFGTPYSDKGVVRFSAEILKEKVVKEAGIYCCSISGETETPDQNFNLLTTKTPEGNILYDMGNPQVRTLLPHSTLFFYGIGNNEYPKIFAYNTNSNATSMDCFLKPGQVITNTNYIVAEECADTFHTYLSASDNMVVAEAILYDKNHTSNLMPALLASINGSDPELIIFANGEIPGGGGNFSGNGFPFVTDGVRVAFWATYVTEKFGETAALFVWNSNSKTTTKVLDCNGTINGEKFTNLQFSNCSFSDGQLAVAVENSDLYSVYILDLSGF